MKTVMKKLLSLVLVAMMLVSAVPFQAFATETEATDVAAAAETTATYTILVHVKLDGSSEVAETIKIENVLAGQTLFLDRIAYRDGYEFAGVEGGSASPAYTVSNDAEVTVLMEKKAEETTVPTTEATEPAETTAPATEPKDDDIIISNEENYITLVLDLNYEGSTDKYVKVVDPDTRMGIILEEISDPTRENYVFAGWYWDDDYDYKVKDNEYLTDSNTKVVRIYAKWTRKSSANNVLLSIYLNGKTSSAAKIVDISGYGEADGMIDISEVRTVVQKYFTAKDSEGINYDGLFTYDTWNRGAYDDSDEANYVTVNANDDTYVYVMIYNAKTGSSSSSNSGTSSSNSGTADSTNPKTGDQIFMAVTVMAVSASALALVYFFNKKRATK